MTYHSNISLPRIGFFDRRFAEDLSPIDHDLLRDYYHTLHLLALGSGHELSVLPTTSLARAGGDGFSRIMVHPESTDHSELLSRLADSGVFVVVGTGDERLLSAYDSALSKSRGKSKVVKFLGPIIEPFGELP